MSPLYDTINERSKLHPDYEIAVFEMSMGNIELYEHVYAQEIVKLYEEVKKEGLVETAKEVRKIFGYLNGSVFYSYKHHFEE